MARLFRDVFYVNAGKLSRFRDPFSFPPLANLRHRGIPAGTDLVGSSFSELRDFFAKFGPARGKRETPLWRQKG